MEDMSTEELFDCYFGFPVRVLIAENKINQEWSEI